MKEFLILGKAHVTFHIDSEDIVYIRAEGNYSNIFLTDGKMIHILMKLKDIEETIKKCLPMYQKDFQRVGRSIIINRRNLFKIEVVDKKPRMEFYGKRTEDYMRGYIDGYNAGHKDGCSGTCSTIPPDSMVVEENEDDSVEVGLPNQPVKKFLQKLRDSVSMDIFDKIGNDKKNSVENERE